MPTIVDYVCRSGEAFSERPFSLVDSLCLSWLAYLRLPENLGMEGRAGMRLLDLASLGFADQMTASLHDPAGSRALFEAMAASPRFAGVRACLHVSEHAERKALQFSATTFVLPDCCGSYVAFRGTDNTTVGWKENFHLLGSEAIPAQRQATAYVERVAEELGGRLWVGGHSKGGCLAAFACATAAPEAIALVECCFSHDGPGIGADVRATSGYNGGVALVKTVPQESLVGMLFERSQEGLVVVRSSAKGVLQHDPLTWQVLGDEFDREQGMSYDAWRLSQRVNDWLDAMDPGQRDRFADTLELLVDATGETSFSGLLGRWSQNRPAMRSLLDAMPREDAAAFKDALDDLAATLLLGSWQEYQRGGATPVQAADAAARRLEDATARMNDRLTRLDHLTGR